MVKESSFERCDFDDLICDNPEDLLSKVFYQLFSS